MGWERDNGGRGDERTRCELDSETDHRAAAGATDAKRSALRARLLDLAQKEIHETGFSGLRVDTLLAKAGSTKGAFYHHFPSKTALGYAVVDEVLAGYVDEIWNRHLGLYDDPIVGIEASMRYAMTEIWPDSTTLGCPFNNLAQEMSALDAGFRERIGALFAQIIDHIAEALTRGIATGHVRADIDPQVTATFIFAALEGAIGLVKTMGAEAALDQSTRAARVYFSTLRPSGHTSTA